MLGIGYAASIWNNTPFRSPWTIARSCRYTNPLATSLSCGEGICQSPTSFAEVRPYKLEPICLLIGPNKFVDVSVFHPLGYHCKYTLIDVHHHPQEGQYIRMTKGFPSNNLLAKPLWWPVVEHKPSPTGSGTHTRNLAEVARRINPQPLNRYLAILMLSLPNIRISPPIQWRVQPVIANRDLCGFWNQALATTYLAQSP